MKDYLAILAILAAYKSVFSIGSEWYYHEKKEYTKHRQCKEATMFTELRCVRRRGSREGVSHASQSCTEYYAHVLLPQSLPKVV